MVVNEETVTSIVDSQENPSIKEVLKNGPFMTLFSAQFIENIGRAISGLAIEFLIYEYTQNPILMGLLAIIWLLPFMVVAPFAGVLTDRFDQRKIMLYSNIMSFIASFGFVIIYLLKDSLIIIEYATITTVTGHTVNLIMQNVTHVLWPLFLLLFINSTSVAFFFPARSAYTRLIVKKKNLLVANSIGSTVFQIATIVGFVLAGILAKISYLFSFITDASTFLISGLLILVIFKIGKKPPEAKREQSRTLKAEVKSIFSDMKVGYKTIGKYPKISYMLVIFTAITFTFSAINVLFIFILQGEMGLGQDWYGYMQAIMGISGILMAVVLMSIGKLKRKILLLNISYIFATVGIILFAIIRNKWLMAGLMFLFGLIIVLINIPSSTLIQETVPYDKQGRVFGAQQLVQGFAQLVGMGLVSFLAKYLLPMYILLGSSGLLIIIITVGFIYSSIKGLHGSDYTELEESEETKTEDSDDSLLIDDIQIKQEEINQEFVNPNK